MLVGIEMLVPHSGGPHHTQETLPLGRLNAINDDPAVSAHGINDLSLLA